MADANRGALVTGGTGALGQWVVRSFLDAGWRVHVSWLFEQELTDLEALLGDEISRVRLHRADVTDEKQVDELFAAVAEAGSLGAVANVVGGFVWAPVAQTDAATWTRMLSMNATSCFLCCRAAASVMGEGGGRIVNVAAAPALGRGAANMSAYSASKAAVLNLTLSLAEELAPAGITVNAIVPSMIDTPANRAAMPDADRSTWLPPGEIAGVVRFLASDAARIVTGTAVNLSLG